MSEHNQTPIIYRLSKSIAKLTLTLIVVLVLFMAVSNPSKSDFIDYYETAYATQPKSVLGQLFTRMTKGAVGLLADQAVRHNYIVFSLYDMGQYGVFIGAFGQFWRVE